MMAIMMSLEAEQPETEVTEKSMRRRFTAEYKRQILDEAAACTERGEVDALVRREGLCSSDLTEWRKQADRGELAGLTPRMRGLEVTPVDPRDKRIAELEREVTKLNRRAVRAGDLVDVQEGIAAVGEGTTRLQFL